MQAVQTRLFPDARPLVERLGGEFFKRAPDRPGVYLMRDESEVVLYVGKAKSLRKRLGSYRVANPERMPRRLLRLLNQVRRIDCELCADEAAALERESALLRSLQPKFNRAGVWPPPPRFIAWRSGDSGLEISITEQVLDGWKSRGPLRGGTMVMRVSLVRLLWHMTQTERGMLGMPAGWFHGRLPEPVVLPIAPQGGAISGGALARFEGLLNGGIEEFGAWVQSGAAWGGTSAVQALLEEDLECVMKFFRV